MKVERVLVVYYSRTGTTKRVAIEIANALGADVEPISDHVRRSGPVGYLRSGFEAAFRRETRIDPVAHDPASYDLVVLGSPVWNASLSSPMRTFIRHHRRGLNAVAFFCTCGGRGGERVLAQMARESGRDPTAGLVLREAEVSRGAFVRAIQGFVDRIRRAPGAGTRSRPPAQQVQAPAE